eukprot:TRINITY_DN1154_c0_g2_i2.p1 TRINITY_DN1154_c0_g2~~TRINITY_DN1154_c0_g2_i2.p1  ORF type:complete len:425 (-),score=67.30 TRINITY_DN1154_c0_g2_i2:957-2231(-)
MINSISIFKMDRILGGGRRSNNKNVDFQRYFSKTKKNGFEEGEHHKSFYQVPNSNWKKKSHVNSMDQYHKLWNESIQNPNDFWGKIAKENIDWIKPFSKVSEGSFEKGNVTWFEDGQLNVSYNCLDRHVKERGNQTAIIWEGDSPKDTQHISYRKALEETCKLSNALKSLGVKKGDTVCLYLPNCPHAAYAMLACARIGAIHNFVFAGFSAESLADRVNDSNSKIIITADEYIRGGKKIPLKDIVDQAVESCPSVQKVLVLRRNAKEKPLDEKRDLDLQKLMDQQSKECKPEVMNAEDPLFFLYTSGSTGKPKGLVHTQAGYLLFTSITHRYVFDYQPGDVYACVADVGWITGHSYIVYGPLANGATTFMFEGLPTNPDAGRYWDMVQRHKITQLYTAPTALRSLVIHFILCFTFSHSTFFHFR